MAQGDVVRLGTSGAVSPSFLLLGMGTSDIRDTNIEVEYYLITVAEITELVDTTNVLVWNNDEWNGGKVYG